MVAGFSRAQVDWESVCQEHESHHGGGMCFVVNTQVQPNLVNYQLAVEEVTPCQVPMLESR